jgi:hypothetical protein
MEKVLAATVALLVFSCAAQSQPFTITVPAGQTTTVFTYRPFKLSSCSSASAVATLSVKPQHGRVSHYLTPATIPTMDRFTNKPTGCVPKPTTGFAVTYTPDPSFHGIDTFSLNVEFKEIARRTTDVFTIIVQ